LSQISVNMSEPDIGAKVAKLNLTAPGGPVDEDHEPDERYPPIYGMHDDHHEVRHPSNGPFPGRIWVGNHGQEAANLNVRGVSICVLGLRYTRLLRLIAHSFCPVTMFTFMSLSVIHGEVLFRLQIAVPLAFLFPT